MSGWWRKFLNEADISPEPLAAARAAALLLPPPRSGGGCVFGFFELIWIDGRLGAFGGCGDVDLLFQRLGSFAWTFFGSLAFAGL